MKNIKNLNGMQHLITPFDMSAGLYRPWQNGYEALCRAQGIKMVNKLKFFYAICLSLTTSLSNLLSVG